jgi:hypothetical protein
MRKTLSQHTSGRRTLHVVLYVHNLHCESVEGYYFGYEQNKAKVRQRHSSTVRCIVRVDTVTPHQILVLDRRRLTGCTSSIVKQG